MGIRTILSEAIAERTSARITAILKDENGNPIDGSLLTTLELTLYVLGSPGSIINNRNRQDILNINGGTVDNQGNLIYQMSPEDNQIMGSGVRENHIALFEWTWSAGSKAGRYEILLQVMNIEFVP